MTVGDSGFLATLRARIGEPARLGVAVSGGGDSVALLHLLADAFRDPPAEVFAATVDHGLRPDSGDEARIVGRLCESLGIGHATLRWTGWSGEGNLQDQARRARYRLLTDWARAREIPVLAIGHTADDQAETVLMRLARASGVTGLSAMPARRELNTVTLVRPLLGVTRAELRNYLRSRNIAWSDDPSNSDDRFDRIKARRALPYLQAMGITAGTLAEVAANMSRARAALDHCTAQAGRNFAGFDAGDVVLDRRAFDDLPDELARRLVLRSVAWISGAEYPPRRIAVGLALSAIKSGKDSQLDGCLLLCRDAEIRICREAAAVRDQVAPADGIWDGRWRLHGPAASGARIRALGLSGIEQCPDWRDTGRPRAALLASPSAWDGDVLLAAPLAGLPNGWRAELLRGEEEFYEAFLTH